ncbi:LRR receptor-like serine/threonine-protein kinase FLS2 isoform X1 [Cucurbita moschata]|uniref:LRR receptor-like serine/threonine-protein kinase FLS2 isoform X1 n=1 Tax=Cucurbita moschata TaxID=3662 RepID=A0A6J1E6S3_CUCMO|nr:LRR receptor-like serine/threonine-protein kinase FLS2 isoform X1 [Cucurbita moschata]
MVGNFLLFLMLFFGMNICSGSGNPSEVLCIESEREALLRFKKGLVDPLNRLSSWDVKQDCCKWVGISCDNSTGYVKELILANNEFLEAYQLKGNVSDSILNLKHLTHFDLSNNDFEGVRIPSFLGSMVSLRYLNLSRARFSGLIPHELGNLSNLNHLGLGGTYPPLYTENLGWLHGLPSLLKLNLMHVDLSNASSWLLDINKLPSLQELYLWRCKLVDFAPLDHVNFTSLSVLDISSNNFKSFLPKWISNLSSLVSLDLSRNDFQGPIPCALQNMSALSYLDLSSSGFNSSTIPSCLYTLHNLQHLTLRNLGLNGGISNNIANLTNLVSIDLSNNELDGRIPRLIGNLCNLEKINLSNNKLAENISEIFESFSGCLMDSLISLDLSYNKISSHLTDKIAKLKNLSILDLARNSITGPIPESIGNLSSLTTLNINYNELSGTLPKSMGFLSSLQVLTVSDNHLEGILSEDHFANLANLEILEMNDNNFTLNFATEWIPPFNLYMIRLRSCIVGPQFPKWLKSQKKLSWVDLSNAKLSDTIPDWFWSWSSQCIYLNLSHNQLYGTLPHILFTGNISIMDLRSNLFHGSLPRLVSSPAQLDLSNNFFSGNITHFLCRSQFLGISVLHLGNNFLSGNIPNCWENWESLQVLSLDNNNLSGMIPTSMGSLTILVSLHLRNNSLSGVIPRALQSCLELRALDLSLNAFHGKIPAWIGMSLLKLMTLNLGNNEISGLIPKELCHLSYLQIMDISNNNLSGSIPHCFGNFTSMATKRDLSQRFHFIFNKGYAIAILENAYVRTKGSELYYDTILALMTSIDLSNNNLSGEIPEEITNLFALRSLNLSINHLRGTIPDRIGGMKDLESLDLSRNQLWGRIPPSMSELSFLSYLNLSYNNLSGPIPTGTQLQRFTPFSFIGNELCGDPLNKSCGMEGVTPKFGNENGKESEGGSIIDGWFYLSMGIGFVFGFWGIWGPLLLSKAWRVKYFLSVCHKLA